MLAGVALKDHGDGGCIGVRVLKLPSVALELSRAVLGFGCKEGKLLSVWSGVMARELEPFWLGVRAGVDHENIGASALDTGAR